MRAVLLNDTSFAPHHGCRHTVAAIRTGLARRGIGIVASAPVHAIWQDNKSFLVGLGAADVIVINGEGTLHHGAPAGERLLEAACHPLRRGRPIALINALWQDNPKSWIPLLKKIDLITVRDRRSQRMLASDGINAELCPDLSFHHVWDEHRAVRNPDRIVFGDSVYPDKSEELLAAYRFHDGPKLYLPIKSWRRHEVPPLSWRRRFSNFRRHLRMIARSALDHEKLLARDAAEYVSYLARSGLHVTGRYHGACLSIAIGAPFAAVASNSHKIEALIEDIGLDPKRIAKSVAGALKSGVGDYSEQERVNIAAWLVLARDKADKAFDRIAALASRAH